MLERVVKPQRLKFILEHLNKTTKVSEPIYEKDKLTVVIGTIKYVVKYSRVKKEEIDELKNILNNIKN